MRRENNKVVPKVISKYLFKYNYSFCFGFILFLLISAHIACYDFLLLVVVPLRLYAIHIEYLNLIKGAFDLIKKNKRYDEVVLCLIV